MTTRASTIWEQVLAAPDHTGTTLETQTRGNRLDSAGVEAATLRGAGRALDAVCGNPRGRPPICSLNSPELAAEIGDDASRLVRLRSQVERACLAREARSYQAGVSRLQLGTGPDHEFCFLNSQLARNSRFCYGIHLQRFSFAEEHNRMRPFSCSLTIDPH